MSIAPSMVSPTFKSGYVGETDSSSPASRFESVATEIDRFSVQAIQGEQVSDQAAPLVGIPNSDIQSSMEGSQPASAPFSTETSQTQQRVMMQLKNYTDGLPPIRYRISSMKSSSRYYKSQFNVYSPGLNPLNLTIKPCRQQEENLASKLRYQLYTTDTNRLLATFVVELLGTNEQRIENGLKYHQRDNYSCKLLSGEPDEIGVLFIYEILDKGPLFQIKISIEDVEGKPFIKSLFFISGASTKPSQDLLGMLSSAQSSERGPMRHTPIRSHTQTGPYAHPREPSHSPHQASAPSTVDYNSICALSGKTKTFTEETAVIVPCGHTVDYKTFYGAHLTLFDRQLFQKFFCPEPSCGEVFSNVIQLKSRLE